ncbi:hypothetical protein V496_05488 [Pseudogymnoascus sp. VKM F-4515 (FW-2607)]|nr:hypothetical protein V496_05488 [Pseudogymnoascus sp. VKM F-4515 (FW-2607)]
MSGVEVAGIVLAVLPLFISALEHYENGLDPIRAFLEFDSELPNQIRKLRDQHINYNLTMKLLLSSIAESEEVDEMLSDPGGACWKDGGMQKRLEERLDESYLAYLDTIKHIEEIMKTIAKDLKIDHSDRTTRADLQSLLIKAPRKDNHYEFGRRVKFGMKLKKFKRLLDELDSENRKLERFTDKTERLEPYRSAKPTSMFNPPLNDIRLYAKNLYGVLCVGAGCSQSRHQAKLQLEKRLYPKRTKASWKQSKEVSQSTRPCFRVSMYASRWQDVEVQILDSEYSADEQRANQPKPTSQSQGSGLSKPNPSTGPVALSAVTGNKGLQPIEETHILFEKQSGPHGISTKMLISSKKGAGYSMSMSNSVGPILNQSFGKVQSSMMNGKSAQTSKVKPVSKAVGWAMSEAPKMTLHELPIHASKQNTLLEVIDICSAIRRCKTRKICLGLCLDHGGTLRRALSIPQPEKQGEEKPSEEVTDNEATSLNKLLMPDPDNYGHTLSRKDRMSLALILASSFVQLEATQWIQESWGKEDIVFDRTPDAPGDGSIDLSKPYILHSIEKHKADNKTPPFQKSRNYSLLSLGILLLELSTGQSFEQHLSRIKGKSTASLDPPEESVERLMKLSEVRKWLLAVQDDLSSGFHGAIWHCVKSYFDEESGKSEEVYRQAVLDQVVLPLQDDLQSFLGTRTL